MLACIRFCVCWQLIPNQCECVCVCVSSSTHLRHRRPLEELNNSLQPLTEQTGNEFKRTLTEFGKEVA